MNRVIGFRMFALGCLLTLFFAATLQGAHPPIMLLDAEGNEINPITGDNADQPFSTAMTCGICHDYETITGGYHFQMGWDVVSDTFGVVDAKPWQISNGMMGKWCPLYFRQLAKKENESADAIDLTVYDFVGFSDGNGSPYPCGACHPGGGGLEYDREGNRYDEMMAENPELAETLDGDYYQSKWHESGVVEADCFVCHLDGYAFEERTYQLEQGNYKWAVVSGTGYGIVSGSVKRGREPSVVYNTKFFNADGTIKLDVSWPPPDKNCVFCHGQSDSRKRGFSWNDIHNSDVHNSQGISCAACHPSGLDHQFAKGNARALNVADHLDDTMMDCKECHADGYLGATVPDHHSVRPSHLERIACEACHIPSLNLSAVRGVESATGELEFTFRPDSVDDFGEYGTWYPDYERWIEKKIYPFNTLVINWWGNYQDGVIYPLFLREQEAIWPLYADRVTDDNDDGDPEVNRGEEILAGIEATARGLDGNQRFSEIHPVYVKAGTAWHLNEDGVLDTLPFDEVTCIMYSISHNVAPARFALGVNGCGDCHDHEAHFFKGRRVLDLYDSTGAAVTRGNGYFFGCNPFSFTINTFHQQILSPIVSILIIIVIFLVILHYHSYGPKHIPFIPNSGEVKRFSLYERGLHLFRLISFVVLSVTGLIMAFNLVLWQQLLFKSPQQMLEFHIGFGIVFLITTILGIVSWYRDAIFKPHDREWMKKFGGYLGHKGEFTSGRFNAGQKMFYWFTSISGILISVTGVILTFKPITSLATVCITSTIHNILAFIMIAGVLAHAYLGTVANPGTWRVLVDGFVTRIWAEHHHPQWYREKMARGEVETWDEAEGDQNNDPDPEAGKANS